MPSYLTVYPDPHVETLTVDGLCARGIAGTWAEVRDGAGTASSDSDSSNVAPRLLSSNTTDAWARITRALLLFDCRALTSAAQISDASLSLRGSAVANNYAGSVIICASAPAANTAVATGDYLLMRDLTTPFSNPFALSGWSTDGYNVIPLIAAGIAAIVKSGDTSAMTKLGLRINWDITNTPPTWRNSREDSVTWRTADYANLTSDPYLYITYTLGGSPYTLTADAAVFALTANAATLRAARRLVAGTPSFVLTANAATLRAARRLVAGTASFALTANAATLRAARRLAAAAASFALTANAATLRAARRLAVTTARFTLTCNTVTLRAARKLAAATATYVLTVLSVVLRYGGVPSTAVTSVTATIAENDVRAILPASRVSLHLPRNEVRVVLPPMNDAVARIEE